MNLSCKLCSCDLVEERGGRRCIAGTAWRATVLLTSGHTTDVTVCECCRAELQTPAGLTRLRNRCNELLAVEIAEKLEHERKRTGAREAPPLDPAVTVAAIGMAGLGYLHVFGARPWKEVTR